MNISKKEVRQAIKQRLEALSLHEREIESRILCRELKKILGKEMQTIAIYMPFSDEPDLRPLISEWLSMGVHVSVPSATTGRLIFHTIHALSDVARDPVTGIPEPKAGTPLTSVETITTIIVPGRAFTPQGDRMGRGNGGYDQWISTQRKHYPNLHCIGLCFDCQILSSIPVEAHDERMNEVLTATKRFFPV